MIAKAYTETGMLLKSPELQLVHIKLSQGEHVAPHDHKGQEVFFTPVRGEVEVTLSESETHRLSAGAVLHFAGEATIAVEALVDSEFFVYLVNRR